MGCYPILYARLSVWGHRVPLVLVRRTTACDTLRGSHGRDEVCETELVQCMLSPGHGHVVNPVGLDHSLIGQFVDRHAIKVQDCRRSIGEGVQAERWIAHPQLGRPPHTDLIQSKRGGVV